MARAAAIEVSDDDLPDLATLLSLPAESCSGGGEGLRRSPRKQSQPHLRGPIHNTVCATEISTRKSRSYEAPTARFSAKKRQDSVKENLAKRPPARRASAEAKPGGLANDFILAAPRTGATELHEEIKVTQPPCRTVSGEIPLLPRGHDAQDDLEGENDVSVSASSDNRLSPKNKKSSNDIIARMSSLKLTHVDSLLLPLSKLAVAGPSEGNLNASRKRRGRSENPPKTKAKSDFARPSSFVLKEAQCNDDSDDSGGEDDGEDEDTDLSGFIVDDAAEISFHDTSDAASDSDEALTQKRKVSRPPRRRRLQRGSPVRRAQHSEDESSDLDGASNKENEWARGHDDSLENAMQKMQIGRREGLNTKSTRPTGEVEVIDLTSSPDRSEPRKFGLSLDLEPELEATTTAKELRGPIGRSSESADTSNPFEDDFDAILKFSPPRHYSPTKKAAMENNKAKPASCSSSKDSTACEDDKNPSGDQPFAFKTPPHTPTKSKSGLKSPSKLLSPSKKAHIPHSPHRQSVDAFWDLEIVNTWNDAYSPKKAPLASPIKALERFRIWEDSDDEDSGNDSAKIGFKDVSEESSSLPSPCSSPTKKHEGLSPSKLKSTRSPKKPNSKNPEKEAKKRFNEKKEQLGKTLLADLDANVTANRLQALAAGTGGVEIKWSKTLRSTAGRANWKRTVTRASSGSPAKDRSFVTDGEAKVQHYASIELAEKIVDCEERLVSTLAHEFCHLANFMVSGVRDQPHGREFKAWAAKVTAYLREDGRKRGDSVRKGVEVTTKHAYVIDYKYLWVCVGREQNVAQKYLGIEGEGGCGGEYGRHGRSIDVERQRCGRCKGTLKQVRPKPRGESPVRKGKERVGVKRRGKGSEVILSGLERELDLIELND